MNTFDSINFSLKPTDILAVKGLLFPGIIEIDGCLFLEFQFNQGNYEYWKQYYQGDKLEIEKMINHVHVYDLFDHVSDDVDDKIFGSVGEVLAYSWNIHFSNYVKKKMAVIYVNSDRDYGPTLYVYQER